MKILIYIFCAFCIAIITPLFTSQVSVSSHYPSSAAMASLLQAGITVFIFWLFFFVIAKAMIRKWESRKSRSGTKKKDPESCNVGTNQPSGCSSEPEPSFSPPPEAAANFSAEPDPPRSVKKSSRPRRKAVLLSAIIVFLALSLSISVYFNIRLSGEYQRGYSAGIDSGYDLGYNNGHLIGIEEGTQTGQEQALNRYLGDGITIGRRLGYFDRLVALSDCDLSNDELASIHSISYRLGLSDGSTLPENRKPMFYDDAYDFGYHCGQAKIGYFATLYSPTNLQSLHLFIAACHGYMEGFISAASPLKLDFVHGFVEGCISETSLHTSFPDS